VGPFTGPTAIANKEALAGAKLYLDTINQAGGVNGRRIELVESDDKQDPKITEQLVTELITKKEVIAFFMPRTSPSSQALLNVAEPAGVPIIAPQVGPDFFYETKQRLAFTVRASFAAEVIRALELQLRLGRTSFAFLAADDAFGNPLVAAATSKLSEKTIKPLISKVDNRKADVSVALDTFLSAKPSAIFLLCSNTCASEFVNKYRERGGNTQFIAISNNSSNAFVKALGANARGVIVMQVMPPPTSKTIRVSREYASSAAKNKLEPSHAGLQGYISARVLVEAIRKSGKNVTSASLISAMESIQKLDLGDFIVSYSGNNHNGSAFVEETIINRDGKFLR
jgi:branched-chain amino acid transport system substrate-binding protein